ncbi:MAG: hypothetical protein ACR2LC_00630 [Pyrinomonadaceae bacterium]
MIAALEKINFTESLSFMAYGVRLMVRSDDSEALRRLLPFFPLGWKRSAPQKTARVYTLMADGGKLRRKDKGFGLLYADGVRLCRTTSEEELCSAFESNVTIHVAEHAPRRVFVHAGVVGWHGRAILIPGRSFSGKTSLVAELVRAGAIFYSDECAVLDNRGRVHPYPRSLHIREHGDQRQTSYRVEELGGTAGTKPLPVATVLLSKYKAGAMWRPRRLSPGEGTLELFANTFPARKQPEKALAALKRVAMQARIFKGVRGEAQQIVQSLITDLLQSDTNNFKEKTDE